jgi:hypothetical protein
MEPTKMEAPTLAQAMSAARPAAERERDTKKRRDRDRRILDIVMGRKRGRL